MNQIDYDNLDLDLLRLLFTGKTSEWAQPSKSATLAIRSPLGRRGFVAFGPYIRLEPGDYGVTFEFSIGRALPNASVTVDIVTDFGTRVVATDSLTRVSPRLCSGFSTWGESGLKIFAFTVARGGAQDSLFEFRVLASRRVDLFLTAVRLQKLPAAIQAVEVMAAASP